MVAMRTAVPAIGFVVLLFAPVFHPTGADPTSKTPLFQDSGDPARQVTVKLGVESGRENDHGRDTRAFTIPVACADAKGNFTWGCAGQTIITASFAEKARVEVRPNDSLAGYVDGNGKPLFLGEAPVELVFGGQPHQVTALVMRDGQFTRNILGVIGFDCARARQWEIDPRVPQITFRPLGAEPKKKPLATLPLKMDQDTLLAHVKIRGVEQDIAIMPQNNEFQASVELQKAWAEVAATGGGGGGDATEAKTQLGTAQVLTFRGTDGIQLAENIFETNFLAFLLPDSPGARSGIGGSILNRFVYCVDAEKKELHLIERVPPPAATTKPAAK
jgi:hypothetical protein